MRGSPWALFSTLTPHHMCDERAAERSFVLRRRLIRSARPYLRGPPPNPYEPLLRKIGITAVQGVAITPVTMIGVGGTGAPYTFSATGLPAGISMSTGGTISGTPTVSGTFSYTGTLQDAAGNVGPLSSGAHFRLKDWRAVRQLLHALAHARAAVPAN